MMSRNLSGLVVLAGVVASIGSAQGAVDIPKEGRLDYNYCMVGKSDYTELRPGLAMGAWDLGASTYANGGTKAFDRMGSRCVGWYEIVDGKYSDTHVCTLVDADGDKWMSKGQTHPDFSGKWTAIGGTGKYEGLTASGIFQQIGDVPPPFAPGAFNKCNRITGTYKLR